MEKTKVITRSHAISIVAVMTIWLVLASIGPIDSAHSQANTSSATKNVTSAAKSMAGAAGNETMGTANKTSEAASGSMTNATQGGNQSASNSTNPLANVPIIGKLFGGK